MPRTSIWRGGPRLWIALSLAALAAGFAISPAGALGPRTIPFQGVLADASGKPRPAGTYTATFRIYDSPQDGSLLWTETGDVLQVTGGNGVFSTTLGGYTALPASLFDAPAFLEVQIQGDASPLKPRMRLQAVPSSLGLSLPISASAYVGKSSDNGGAALTISNFLDGIGVLGQSSAGFGVQGQSAGSGAAIYGHATGGGAGVYGDSQSNTGIFGTSASSVGIWGYTPTNTGVYGQSGGGYGVGGVSLTGVGVYGESVSDGKGTGNHGVYGKASVSYRAGVYGTNSAPLAWGLYGDEQGPGGTGVVGTASGSATSVGVFGSTLTGYGVEGQGNGADAVGVRGQNASGAYAELGTYFGGSSVGAVVSGGLVSDNVSIVNGLYAGGLSTMGSLSINHDLNVSGNKKFLIDDPLDPANKTLAHSCAEGPEPLDLYNGNVTTDASGTAVVHLPDYFEALNKDFRYQLTCIGQFAQAIVAEEIKDNQFTIRTDKPNVKVSWLVTGVRNDAYMKAHPPVAEELKPADQRGRYLDPASYGLPPEKGISVLKR